MISYLLLSKTLMTLYLKLDSSHYGGSHTSPSKQQITGTPKYDRYDLSVLIRNDELAASLNIVRAPLAQWVISNKLDHFRFARIAIHFLQCRWLQADDKEIVNIELTREIIITKVNRAQQIITADFINPGNMVACNQTTLKWLIFCRVSDNMWFDALNRL